MAEIKKRGRPPKPKSEQSELVKPEENNMAVQVATQTVKKQTRVQQDIKKGYRDEKGVRIQKYRRFKEGEDYEAADCKTLAVMSQSIFDNIERYRKRGVGQPPKYETIEEFMQSVQEYIEYIMDANKDDVRLIPDVEGLAAFMLISRDTLLDWEKTRSPQYSFAIKTVKNQFAYYKKQLALTGKTPSIVFATDFNNNHGYTQKQEIEVRATNPLGDAPDQKALAERAAQEIVGDFTEVNE